MTEGVLAGTRDPATGVARYAGIPFAAPPVGPLRWRPPEPPKPWSGVRSAVRFGPRAMQRKLWDDMIFRSDGMSEDCLYLNVWTPAKPGEHGLPVLFYVYGGGFQAGDGSEPRYDGAAMAAKGIVMVTVNYRLGPFGFLALPALTADSPHRSSGNYGLLDQAAALAWVHANIAAFGGDPARITIAGESAGSSSVSALMASPFSRDLIAGAIGESGSTVDHRSTHSLASAEALGARFVASLGLGGEPSLAALRGLSATVLLAATDKPDGPWFWPCQDGWFMPKPAADLYGAGEQARVPLLVGTNSEEGGSGGVMRKHPYTVAGYREALRELYSDNAEKVFSVYPAATDGDVELAARDLAGDRFIAFSTWLWLELATKSGGRPTWYYEFDRPRPPMRSGPQPAASPVPHGAPHASEIEYALGNLALNPLYAWTPEDDHTSATMQAYFANFVKTGDPNGAGLPVWPLYGSGQRMVLAPASAARPDWTRARYEVLRSLPSFR